MRFELIPTDFSAYALQTVGYTISSPKFERTNFYFLHPHPERFFGSLIKNTGIIIEYICINGINPLIKINFQHSIMEDMMYWSTIYKVSFTMKFPYFLVEQNLPR